MTLSNATWKATASDPTRYSFTLGVSTRLDHIKLIRGALSGALSNLGVLESSIFAIELAVSELLTNSIEHGYCGDTQGQIEIRFELYERQITIELWDSAPPFTAEMQFRFSGPISALPDPTEEWPPRGHGIQIVRQIVDSIAMSRELDRNCIKVTKVVERELE